LPSPRIECPSGPSDTGAYRISWKGPEGPTYVLEENGAVLYQGPEQASTVSGREKGSYAYRVGVIDHVSGEASSWSQTCQVEVSPPPLSLALGLMGTGCLVFLVVLLIIIRGHKAHRRGELE